MRCLGIDIGSFSIKVAAIEASSKSYTLVGFDEYRFSPDPNKDRQLETIEILRSIAETLDPSNTKVVIAVPQSEVSVRLHHFPFKERQKVLKSIAFELEDEIPLDPDLTIFDAKIVELKGQLSHTLTVACPKDSVQANLQRLTEGGIDPDIISVEGLALSNVFERWWEAPKEELPPENLPPEIPGVEIPRPGASASKNARVILHLGHKRSLVLIYRDQVLVAARSILWGGHEITEALAKVFSIPYVEALNILQTKSFILMNSAGATREQVALSNTVASVVDQLARDLRLTLLELKTEHGLHFTEIDVMGGISQIQNLAPYLTLSLEVPANIYFHYQHFKDIKFEVSTQNEAVSAVAFGLAIEAMKRPRNPAINLRKGEFQRKNLNLQKYWEKWRLPFQVGVSAFILFFIYSVIRDTLSEAMANRIDETLFTQAKNVAKLDKKEANQAGIQNYLKTQKTIIKNRENLAQLENYNSALDVILKLSDKLGAPRAGGQKIPIDLHKLVIDHDEATIEGSVAKADQLAQVEKAINDVAKSKSVQKQPAAKGAATGFAYKFKVNRQ